MRVKQGFAITAAATVAQLALICLILWVSGEFEPEHLTESPVWALVAVLFVIALLPSLVLILVPFIVLSRLNRLKLLSAALTGLAAGVMLAAAALRFGAPTGSVAVSVMVAVFCGLVGEAGALAGWGAWRLLQPPPLDQAKVF